MTTILTFVHYYLPGYKSGGPLRSISNLVAALGDQLAFKIVTADRDWVDTVPYPQIRTDCWNRIGRAEVYYCSPRSQSLRSFRRLINETDHDVLYLNSFLDPVFTIRPLLLRWLRLLPERPTIIASRGEFGAGAWHLKYYKKQPYKFFAKILGLYGNIIWHASSEYEAEEIRKALRITAKRVHLAPNIFVASDLTTMVEEMDTTEFHVKDDNRLRVLFVSRISPKKNLKGALEILQKVESPVEFNIAGPLDNETYWKSCRDLIGMLPKNVLVNYLGPVAHSKILLLMMEHDLFLFPTYNENFGHVIAEALLSGLPVLTSDQTPWRDLEEVRVGWNLPLDDLGAFASKIDSCARMPADEYRNWRSQIAFWGMSTATDEKAIDDNLKLFLRARYT